ncbi:rhomboid-like protein [Actinomadura scrupuli]|uniref:rhomboid-like protein n=1 Tax=Actinomadura scrupuli TaxID=559629 RepID=UPI003D9A0667
MLGGSSGLMRRYPVPLGYLAGLAVMSTIYSCALSPAGQRSLVAWASTNLDRLPANPVGTLLVSAFVSEDSVIGWLIVGSLALFPLARRFGNPRAVLLAGGAHVLGTLVSQGLTAWRVSIGAVPPSVRGDADVGPSYVIAAALIAVILYGPDRWSRLPALAGWIVLVPTLFEGLTSLEVAGVGHLVSMLAGAVIGGAFVAHETSGRRRAASPGSETAAPLAPPAPPAAPGLVPAPRARTEPAPAPEETPASVRLMPLPPKT